MTVVDGQPRARMEQSRARYPDVEGFVERDGVRTCYEVYGDGDPTVLLVPPWSIVHSRIFKMQIPYLARHARVITFDPRGNGRSDRPGDRSAYSEREYAADALAVLDATATDRAVLVSVSLGAQRCLLLAAEHPQRVSGLALVSPSLPLGPAAARAAHSFTDECEQYEGWAKLNAHYWRRDYAGFVEFFMGACFYRPPPAAHHTHHRGDRMTVDDPPASTTSGPLPGGVLVDPEKLRAEVREKYREVAADPHREYHFHTGRPLAARLGYPAEVVDALPDEAVESFAGVANLFSMRPLQPGERVVDIGSGAGLDSSSSRRPSSGPGAGSSAST